MFMPRVFFMRHHDKEYRSMHVSRFYLIIFFKFNFLAVVVSEISGGPKYILGGLRPWTPHSGKICVPEASTLPHVIVFLISSF